MNDRHCAGSDPVERMSEPTRAIFAEETRRVLRALEDASDMPGVKSVAGETRALIQRIVARAPDEASHTRMISAMNDALTRRVIRLVCEQAQSAAAQDARWCWIALGSEARQEQTLSSDQDNALIFEGTGRADDVRACLLPLAARINDALDQCGFPLCPGQIMAGNPRWCLELHEWREQFRSWMDDSEPEALLNATIFFDMRPLYGATDLADELMSWLETNASTNTLFLFQMTENALRRTSPLGFLRDFALEKSGKFAGTIDLKVNGATLFVDAARIYGLSRGVRSSNTAERLREAGERRSMPQSETRAWIEAFHVIQRLRLKYQSRSHALGRGMHNHVAPDELEAADREALLKSLRQARSLQRRLALDFLGSSRLF